MRSIAIIAGALVSLFIVNRVITHLYRWEVSFLKDKDSRLTIHLENRQSDIRARILTSTLLAKDFSDCTVQIESGNTRLPMGRIMHLDPSCPPGYLELSIDGHRILARYAHSLSIDGKDYTWEAAKDGIVLEPSGAR